MDVVVLDDLKNLVNEMKPIATVKVRPIDNFSPLLLDKWVVV